MYFKNWPSRGATSEGLLLELLSVRFLQAATQNEDVDFLLEKIARLGCEAGMSMFWENVLGMQKYVSKCL